MSPLVAYFLGVITMLVVIIPFWYLAKVNSKIQPVYKDVFCGSVCG
jgi:hypothetical protein